MPELLVASDYNWSVACGYQSALTGVLAGFAFTAIVLILGQRDTGDRSKLSIPVSYTVLSLCAVFYILVIASYLFASITGHDSTPITAARQGIYPSIVFCIGVVMMSLSMVWFFNIYEVEAAIGAASLMFYVALLISSFGIMAYVGIATALKIVADGLVVDKALCCDFRWVWPIVILLPVGLILRQCLKNCTMFAPQSLLRILSVASVILSAVAAMCCSMHYIWPAIDLFKDHQWAKMILSLVLGAFFLVSILALPRSARK